MNSLARISKCVAFMSALLYLGAYLFIALARIQYPFELEWMEGSSLIQVVRILAGEGLYVSPSLEYVPLIYTPLYFYISSAFAVLLGIGFLPLRLVSFLSALGCLLIIFELVHQPTKSYVSGAIAAGLFASTYRLSGAWFDIGRVDSLSIFLLLVTFYLIRKEASIAHVFSGVFFSLAFLTKQSVLVVFAPIMLYCILVQRSRCIFFGGTSIALIAASSQVLNNLSDGWFSYYVFELPAQHTIAFSILPILGFCVVDIAIPLSTACLMLICSTWFSRFSANRHSLFYLILTISMVGLSLAGRLNQGGYDNVLIPGYAALCILFGLAMNRILRSSRAVPEKQRLVVEFVTYSLCALQFVSLRYPLSAQIPTQDDLNAGNRLVSMIREADGHVLVPFHPYLSLLAGKSTYAHETAIQELRGYFGGKELDAASGVQDEITTAVQERAFSLIILDAEGPPWQDVHLYYDRYPLVLDAKVFLPVTGFQTRPELMFLPKGTGAVSGPLENIGSHIAQDGVLR